MAEQQAEKSSIQVIERMMSLLDVLADIQEPVSLKILAQNSGLHPSTAHRILAAMTGAAIVERNDAGAYTLGIRLLELGNIVKSRINIRQVALPYMQQLHEVVGEAVNLGIRHDDEIIYVERTSSGRSLIRVVYLVGGRAPLHLTSVGKLFLAADSAADVRAYAKRTGLPGKTPHSLTRLDTLERNSIKSVGTSSPTTTKRPRSACVASPRRFATMKARSWPVCRFPRPAIGIIRTGRRRSRRPPAKFRMHSVFASRRASEFARKDSTNCLRVVFLRPGSTECDRGRC